MFPWKSQRTTDLQGLSLRWVGRKWILFDVTNLSKNENSKKSENLPKREK